MEQSGELKLFMFFLLQFDDVVCYDYGENENFVA